MGHTDLFNAAPLKTLSCAAHNVDTDRKSLSVCLNTETSTMFWGSGDGDAGDASLHLIGKGNRVWH